MEAGRGLPEDPSRPSELSSRLPEVPKTRLEDSWLALDVSKPPAEVPGTPSTSAVSRGLRRVCLSASFIAGTRWSWGGLLLELIVRELPGNFTSSSKQTVPSVAEECLLKRGISLFLQREVVPSTSLSICEILVKSQSELLDFPLVVSAADEMACNSCPFGDLDKTGRKSEEPFCVKKGISVLLFTASKSFSEFSCSKTTGGNLFKGGGPSFRSTDNRRSSDPPSLSCSREGEVEGKRCKIGGSWRWVTLCAAAGMYNKGGGGGELTDSERCDNGEEGLPVSPVLLVSVGYNAVLPIETLVIEGLTANGFGIGLGSCLFPVL